MARLAFAHLLDDDGADPSSGDGSISGNSHVRRMLAAELLGDMARSLLVLSLLETEEEANDGDDDDATTAAALLSPFLHGAAQALLLPTCVNWHEPLLRGLRLLCLESPRARATLARALVRTEAGAPLAALVGLAMGDHAPTASEAGGLLRACLPPALDGGEAAGGGGLWPALAAVVLGRKDRSPPGTPSPSSPLRPHGRNHAPGKVTTPPSAATAQLSQSPARRAAAVRQRGSGGDGGASSVSLLGRLAGAVAALGDEVEVAAAGPDGLPLLPPRAANKGGGGGDSGRAEERRGERLALLEVEWRLRALLRLAALLAFAPGAPAGLARAVAGVLSPRALAAIVLGLAAAHVPASEPQRGGAFVMDASVSAPGATAAGGGCHLPPPSELFLLAPRAVEPLEIIVAGCRLLLRCAPGADDVEEEDEEGGYGKKNAESRARWWSAVLGESREVAAALYVAWSQGSSRALLEEVGLLLVGRWRWWWW